MGRFLVVMRGTEEWLFLAITAHWDDAVKIAHGWRHSYVWDLSWEPFPQGAVINDG